MTQPFFLPDRLHCSYQQEFVGSGTRQLVFKPIGAFFAHILAFGAGGGGGSGTNNANGGGGGGEGGCAQIILPMIAFPSISYLTVPSGGAGATGGTGTATARPPALIWKINNMAPELLNITAGYGGDVFGSGSAAAYGSPTVSEYFKTFGLYTAPRLSGGEAGSATTTGGSIHASRRTITGGAGGGGVTNGDGGSVLNSYNFPTVAGGSAAIGLDGESGLAYGLGLDSHGLVYCQGGAGGRAGGTTGGNGGHAALGCGGGGGGEGTVANGSGGRGGSAYFNVVFW